MGAYLSIAQTAEELGVCERTVRRRIADGTLRAKRFGPRLLRVNAEHLHRVMAA